ncbi:MAG: hypothetical protein DRJ35_03320 [Thermoprotei archaeon]|nr:MAG: hypothetical protein DRJ35_03320 [Thermoprotei archaeon]
MEKCEICLKPSPKLFVCKKCGRKVCEKHYNFEKKICVACEESLCQICGKRLSIGYCKYCGRLVCEECSIEEGAALVCIECIRKRGSL